MKRKITYILVAIFTVCLLAMGLAACTPENVHTVTYAAGGGSGNAPKVERYEEGETFTVKGSDVFTRDGYVFVGWSDGSKTVEAGSEYTMNDSDIVFTAQWVEEQVATLEGKWSGCQVDGKDLLGIDGVMFDITATAKRDGENAIYGVLTITGEINSGNMGDVDAQSDDADGDNGDNGDIIGGDNGGDNNQGETGDQDDNQGGNETETMNVSMSAALYLTKDEDGNYSAEGCTVSFANKKLTISLSFGGAELQTLEFDSWEPLGFAPSLSGSYTATSDGGAIYNVTFGSNPSFTIEWPTYDEPGSNNGEYDIDDLMPSPDEGYIAPAPGRDDFIGDDHATDGYEFEIRDDDFNVTAPDGTEGYDLGDLDDGYNDEDQGDDGDGTDNGDEPTNPGDDEQTNPGDGQDIPDGPDDGDDDETTGNIQTYDVDKIVEVGEYVVLFVNEPVYGEDGPTSETQSVAMLVFSAGENGTLIVNTGEGEQLFFTKVPSQQA